MKLPALLSCTLLAATILPAQGAVPFSLNLSRAARLDAGTGESSPAPEPKVAVADDFSLNAPVLLSQEDQEPQGVWKGSVNIGGFLSTGNTERRAVNAAANASHRGESDRVTLGFAWDFAQDRNQATKVWNLTQRRTSGRVKYDYFLSEKSYLWSAALAEGDTLADIALRLALTAGYGYQWVERDDLTFLTEVGLGYFSEDYRTPGIVTKETVTVRGAYALMWQINEQLKFLQDVEVFPGLEEASDIFLRKDSRMQVKLTESMFTQLQWILDYDNTPSTGRERLDNRFFVNVGWTF